MKEGKECQGQLVKFTPVFSLLAGHLPLWSIPATTQLKSQQNPWTLFSWAHKTSCYVTINVHLQETLQEMCRTDWLWDFTLPQSQTMIYSTPTLSYSQSLQCILSAENNGEASFKSTDHRQEPHPLHVNAQATLRWQVLHIISRCTFYI